MSHHALIGARWHRRVLGLVGEAVLPASVSTLAMAAPAHAAGTAYYVDRSQPANGNGSQSSPWNSLASVDATTFSPGDQLLIARGTTCNGTLSPQGSGAAGAPIVIDTYGTGAKPIVAGGGASDAVLLSNQQYWEIRNLEITNHGATAANRCGVHTVLRDFGTGNYYRLTNLTIHDVNGDGTKDSGGSAGIQLDVQAGSVPTTFNDVVMDGNNIYTVDRSGINMSSYWMCRPATGNENCQADNSNTYQAWTGVVVQNNTVHDIGGDGIVIQNSQNALVQNNVAYDTSARNFESNAAIWNSDNVTLQFNEAYRTHKLSDNGDGQAWDADYGTNGTIYQYNHSHDNAGGMAMFCGCVSGGLTENAIFRYNISQNDGSGPDAPVLRDYGEDNGQFYNNTIYEPAGSQAAMLTTGGSTLAIANNIIINNGSGGYGYNGTTFTNNIMAGSNTSTIPPGQITADPQLASPGSAGTGLGTVSGYQLTAGSPAIGAGTVIAGSRLLGQRRSASVSPGHRCGSVLLAERQFLLRQQCQEVIHAGPGQLDRQGPACRASVDQYSNLKVNSMINAIVGNSDADHPRVP